MKNLSLISLAFLLFACGQGESPSHADSATSSDENGSVMSAYDPADPQASLAVIEAGQSESTMRFEKLDIALGKVFQTHKYPIEYPFVIEGPDPVTVTSLDSTCGCTNARLLVDGEVWPLNKPIPAGSKGAISAVFDAGHYRRDKASSIKMRGTALNHPETLNLHAFVQPVFEFKPSLVLFGDVMAGDLRDSDPEVEIEVTAMAPFEVVRWKRIPKGVTVKEIGEAQMAEDGERQIRRFLFRLERNAPAGSIFKAAEAETTLGVNMQLTLRANVTGPVKYQPEQRLSFGIVNEGDTPIRMIKVLANTDSVAVPEPIVEIKGKASDVVAATVSEQEPGKSYVIRFRLQEGVVFGRYPGQVHISYPEETGLDSHSMPLSVTVRRLK